MLLWVLLCEGTTPLPAHADLPGEPGSPASPDLPPFGGDPLVEQVGSVGGMLTVDPSGAANYSIPIEVPPGRGGIQPRLSLAYNSGSGNGYLGIGWTLAGLSTIEECSPAQRAKHGDELGDFWCLDGQPLLSLPAELRTIPVPDPGPAEYRTEPDTGIRAHAPTGEPEEGFIVETPDGRRLEYGKAEALVNGNTALTLDQVSDAYGNAMTIEWEASPLGKLVYPLRIDYTSNDAQELPATKRVDFVWKVGRPDPIYVDDAGTESESIDVRLEKIEFRHLGAQGDNVERTYELAYDDVEPVTLLTSVTECVREPGSSSPVGRCKPPTRFDYLKPDPDEPFQDPVPLGGPGVRVNPCHGPFAMDLDRNGRQDLVYGHACGSGSLRSARLGDVDGYTSNDYEVYEDPLWPSPRVRVSPVSVDNDGQGDLLHMSSDRRRFHLVSQYDEGTGHFASEEIVDALGSEISFHVAFDENADGFTDILSCELVSTRWYWVGYDGSRGYEEPDRLQDEPDASGNPGYMRCDQTFVSIRPEIGGTYQALAIAYSPANEMWRRAFLSPVSHKGDASGDDEPAVIPITGPNLFLDATGDGVADGLYFFDDEDDNPDIFRPRVRIADSEGNLSSYSSINLDDLPIADHDEARWIVALDYNDDGFEDLMWNPMVGFDANIHGLKVGEWVVALYDPVMQDFDKLVDTPVLAWWDNGQTTKYAQPRVDGDFNGDGRKDIAVMDTDGEYMVYVRSEVQRGGPSAAEDEWDFHWSADSAEINRAHPYLLWRATNGFGASQSVRYGRTAQLHRYTADPPAACPYPTRCVVPNQHVVAARRIELDDETAIVEEFEYRDARVNLSARERVPFGSVTTRRSSSAVPGQVVTSVIAYETEFGLLDWPSEGVVSFPLASMPNRHITLIQQDGARDVARDTQWRWDVQSTHRGGTMPFIVSRTERTYDEVEGALWAVLNSPSILDGLTPVYESGVAVDDADLFGNPLQARIWMGDRTTTVTRKFEPDLLRWRIHQLMSEEVDQGPDDPNLSTTYTYTNSGSIESIVRQPGGADKQLSIFFTYDDLGNTDSIRQSAPVNFFIEDRVWELVYDDEERTYPVQSINPLGHVSETFWDPILGVPLVARDAFGVETRLAYDAFARPVHQATLSRSGETLELDVEVSYHRLAAAGWPEPSPAAIKRTDSLDGEATTELDAVGRVARKEWRTQFGPGLAQQAWTYDGWGRLEMVSQPNFVGVAAEPGTTYEYDALGRLVRRELPTGASQRIEYEGRTSRVYDAEDNPPWSFERNALGLMERVADARGTAFCYTYDLRGNLDLVKKGCQDPKPAEVVDHDYDVLGRLVHVDDPGAGESDYLYDGFDQLRVLTDGEGLKTAFDYDDLGRLIEVSDPDETSAWTFDEMPAGWQMPPGWVGGTQVHGQLVRAQSSNGQVRDLEYDAFGRVAVSRETNAGEVFETRAGYDDYGRLKALSYPGNGDTPGRTVLHEYGPLGALQFVHWGDDPDALWRLLDMDAAGRVTRERFGNGVETATRFDPLGGVERVTSGIPNAAGWAEKHQDLAYLYTPNGNVWTRDDNVHGTSELFEYDELNRLTSVGSSQPSNGNPTWEYDDFGSIIYHSDVGEMPSEPNGRLISVDGEAAAYDDNGQLLSLGEELEIDYFTSGQPSAIREQYNDIFFDYAPDGSLARREVDGLGSRETVYAGGGYQRTRASDLDYDEIEWKVAAYGRVVGVHRLQDYSQGESTSGGAALQVHDEFYPHADAIGSVNIATNEDGEVAEEAQRSYDAWGVARSVDWDNGGDPPAFDAVDMGFTGHRATTDDGLVDMGARHYDPTRKRFVSPDPVLGSPLDTQSWNRYAYVRDNPLTFTDPSGFSWCPGPLCDRPGGGPPPMPEPPPGEPTGFSIYNSASNGAPGTEAPAAPGLTGSTILQHLGHRALTGSWGSAGGNPGQSTLGKFGWAAAGMVAHAALHPGRSPSWFERHYDFVTSTATAGVQHSIDVAETAGGFAVDYYAFHAEAAVGYGFEAYDHFGGLAEGAWWAASNPVEAVDATVEAAIADVENVAVQVPAVLQGVRDGDWAGAGRAYWSAAGSAWSTAATVTVTGKGVKTLGTLAVVKKVPKAQGGMAKAGAELRPYGGPGGGHHVPAKSAFRDAVGYDAKTALAVPPSELARLGVSHSAVTGAQMTAYRAFAQTGAPLTWDAVAKIEIKALVRGGMAPNTARATVSRAIGALQEAGIGGPTRIPWGG